MQEALATTLRERDATFDFLAQLQTDPHRMPIENASVVWPERLSSFLPVATRRLPRQDFNATRQFAFADRLSFNATRQFALADRLSLNPWHALAEHRPLGNQNRAIYLRLSGLRQAMNGTAREDPGDGTWHGSATQSGRRATRRDMP